jgi:Fe-Mn family superoxide dismutase
MNRRKFIKVTALGVTGITSAMATSGILYSDSENQKQLLSQSRRQEREADRTKLEEGKMPHQLPPLPYDYKALEPNIDEQTMHLHHDIHHKAYVDGLNKAEDMLAQARKAGDYALVKHWSREAAFHGSGHFLHSIFWPNMAPAGKGGGGEPSDALAQAINKDFGSFAAFKAQFSAAAVAVEGSGWAILAYQPAGDQLVILQSEKHQNLTQWGVVPLLVLDVWEHAYYLKYQNRRAEYVNNFFNIINWSDVAARYSKAK